MLTSVLKGIVFFILFVAAAVISAFFTISFIIKSEDIVVCPKLEGKDVLYTLEILSDLSLNTKVIRSVYSSTIPKNHVVDQDPEPGAEIKKGRDVKITVSKGPESIIMPVLAGLSRRQAQLILDQNGLSLNAVSKIRCSRLKKDDVLSQYPSPGTKVKRKQPIDLLVCSGKSIGFYQMTDYSDLTEDEAIEKIEKGPFSLGNVRYLSIKGMPEGVVIDQTPFPGNRTAKSQKVALVVSESKNQNRSQRPKKTGLYRYRLGLGFLKQKVRATLVHSGFSLDIFNDFLKPGEEVWLFVPNDDNPTLNVYVDHVLVDQQTF